MASLRIYYKRSGFDVPDPVAPGEEAGEYVRASAADLILMDTRLADKIDGAGTALQIRADFGVPELFLTAHSDPVLPAAAEKASLYGFFVKPFVEEAVPSAIGKALSMSTEYRSGVNPQERSALYSSR